MHINTHLYLCISYCRCIINTSKKRKEAVFLNWLQVTIILKAEDLDIASAIAHMVVPYGIYIEDYRNLEAQVQEIANIDLIDETLLQKDRSVGYIHIFISREEHPSEAIAFLNERLTLAGIAYEISMKECKNADWENNWKAYFKPMKIGEKLLIQPAWEALDINKKEERNVLYIEPGLAFGTGTHETTKLCILALEKVLKEGDTLLDIGTGSGILAIVGLLYGAKHALAIDIDEMAVQTARDNAKRNNIDNSQLIIKQGSLVEKVTGVYDVVVANIVADAIIELSSQVNPFIKSAGYFIVSGIIDDRKDEVVQALNQNNFKIVETFNEKGWVSMICKFADK